MVSPCISQDVALNSETDEPSYTKHSHAEHDPGSTACGRMSVLGSEAEPGSLVNLLPVIVSLSSPLGWVSSGEGRAPLTGV